MSDEARRYYHADGAYELLVSAEAVKEARIAATAENERLRAENERLARERDEFASVALAGLSGLICTPERGYVMGGGPTLLASDFRRLRLKFGRLADARRQLTSKRKAVGQDRTMIERLVRERARLIILHAGCPCRCCRAAREAMDPEPGPAARRDDRDTAEAEGRDAT